MGRAWKLRRKTCREATLEVTSIEVQSWPTFKKPNCSWWVWKTTSKYIQYIVYIYGIYGIYFFVPDSKCKGGIYILPPKSLTFSRGPNTITHCGSMRGIYIFTYISTCVCN